MRHQFDVTGKRLLKGSNLISQSAPALAIDGIQIIAEIGKLGERELEMKTAKEELIKVVNTTRTKGKALKKS